MNFIKYVVLTGIMIFYAAVAVFACHDEKTDNLASHKPRFSHNMTTVSTEATFANISTTTQCDWYAHFIREGYPFIAEEAAQGQGEHLKVLAQTMGCPAESYPEFATVLKTQHQVLFDPAHQDPPQYLLQQVETLVAEQPSLRKACLKS